MPDPEQSTAGPDQPDTFAARTDAAEGLPLGERADAFSALHDELRTRLESGGSASA
ncbi:MULTISPECIES: hypothetical protein [Curtobacterium]|uniref:hypothetical protein n=1 Tax=Curtobacterium TaxID=2034 RepID=UPI0018E57938|nr:MULTISPECIES: hypothetical protein [Curtobacterium]MCA5923828.1 hypothetical protein [Curtobacterium oceanosedimentum]QQD75768.1 hypothetical protein I8920_13255 [Curtobacterium sp. YC1]